MKTSNELKKEFIENFDIKDSDKRSAELGIDIIIAVAKSEQLIVDCLRFVKNIGDAFKEGR